MATTKVKQINREQYEALVAVGAVAKACSIPPHHLNPLEEYNIAWIRNWYDEYVRIPRGNLYYYTLVESDDD